MLVLYPEIGFYDYFFLDLFAPWAHFMEQTLSVSVEGYGVILKLVLHETRDALGGQGNPF